MDIPDEHVADLDKWYGEEHVPPPFQGPPAECAPDASCSIAGWCAGRTRVCGLLGGAHRFFALALHEWETAPGERGLERLGGVQGFDLGPVGVGVQGHRD